MSQEAFARGSERYVSAIALEQFYLELAFQLADMLADRGLREKQQMTGACKAAAFGDSPEDFELTEANRHPLSVPQVMQTDVIFPLFP